MVTCPSCGSKVEDGKKFCGNCGQKVDNLEANDYKPSYRCPNCGTFLNSFIGLCPSCGIELNNVADTSTKVKEFIKDIKEIDYEILNSRFEEVGFKDWVPGKKIGWILINILLLGIPYFLNNISKLNKESGQIYVTKLASKKISLIENAIIPNDRRDLIELLLFIKSKVDFLDEEDELNKRVFWTNKWALKANDVYQKSQILFPNDEVCQKTKQDIMIKKDEIEALRRSKLKTSKMMLFIVIVIFIALIWFKLK